jgi:NACalpha-BTF3-like transcription factor
MSKELIDIEELRQDNLNFNKGTYEGEVLIKKSLERFKAGRSVLIDKDNNIIAGNKTVQAAATMGMKVRVIETTGDELVAVKRTDIDIDSKEGRELALADNRTAQINLAWDEPNLEAAALQFGLDASDFGLEMTDNEPTAESKGEIDVGTFDTDQTLCIKLTTMQYEAVINRLKQENADLSEALLSILGYYA